MHVDQQVTHCITIGRRPDLLEQTLTSLRDLPEMPILAINDFGDAETNEVFHRLCPTGRLVGPSHRLGHHPAIDLLYRHVDTPFIFHNEDDWLFSRSDFLCDALRLLSADSLITGVCLRDTQDMPLSQAEQENIVTDELDGVRFQRLDALHEQWHGFTLNPHVARKSLWEELGGFSPFKRERHISRHLRASGGYVAFLLPAACSHIGDGRSAYYKPPGRFKRFSRWIRGR